MFCSIRGSKQRYGVKTPPPHTIKEYTTPILLGLKKKNHGLSRIHYYTCYYGLDHGYWKKWLPDTQCALKSLFPKNFDNI